MADKRAFAKFDVGYLDNPKMLDVLDASSTAILMHFASVLYCAQHLTDGVVASKAMQRKAGGSDEDIRILIEHGLWHDAGHDCESCPQPPAGKVYVHDFLEHNRDAAAAKRVSQKRSDAAKARWNPTASPMQNALQTDGVSNAEREREKEKENPSSEIADAIPRQDVQQLLDLLDGCIEANGAKKPSRGKKNADAARLLIDKDGYTVEQVAWMIRWATNDEFWRTNILSMSKLREQFDQLKLKAGVKGNTAAVGLTGEIDPDAILGRDRWMLPAPPEDLPDGEYAAWAKAERAKHDAERLEEARRKLAA